MLFSSNASGLLQLYLLPTDLSSKPKQITNEKESVLGGYISPNGEEITYPLDKDGNEISHLFLLPTEGGDAKQITVDPCRTMGVAWHPDGNEISRSIVGQKGFGIETLNIKTGECFMLKEPTPPLIDIHYSHDCKWIACTSIKSFTDMEILIVNREDPSDTITYNIKEGCRDGVPSWSPDDKKLAIFSEATGRGRIFIQEFQGNDRIMLELEEEEDANPYVGTAVWDPKGVKVYYVVSKNGRSSLHAHPIDAKKEEALPFPEGTVEKPKLSKDGKVLIARHSSMKDPFGIYLHEIGSESIVHITPRDFNIDVNELKKAQSVWYKSHDSRDIHAWYLPAASGTQPYPAVIHAHGGPWGQVSDSWLFAMLDQALSQNGFAVLAPNFRGSTGYGVEFQNLDIGDPGGGDLEDVVHGAIWLTDKLEIDGNKLGITGGSYGGYMTLMALTKKPEVFKTGVSRVPVVDWLQMYKLSDPFFQQFEAALFGGKPRKELKQLYVDRSPITHISNIKAPVMIMAGKNDSRCPIEPIENLIEKLKEINHPHEFFLLEKAGHISAMFNWEESIPIFTKTINYLKKNLN